MLNFWFTERKLAPLACIFFYDLAKLYKWDFKLRVLISSYVSIINSLHICLVRIIFIRVFRKYLKFSSMNYQIVYFYKVGRCKKWTKRHFCTKILLYGDTFARKKIFIISLVIYLSFFTITVTPNPYTWSVIYFI